MLLISSCSSTIQIFETTSTSVEFDGKYYKFENDTVRITYRFWKLKGLMAFDIYNKLDVPLYVDWKKSSFIYNGYKLNYWLDEETSSATAIYRAHVYTDKSDSKSVKEGEAKVITVASSRSTTVRSERLTFIPPHSTIAHAKFNLLPASQFQLDVNTPVELVTRNDNPKRKTKLYSVEFSIESSPAVFRNYVTFSLTEEMENEFAIDHGFYVSKALEMDTRHFMYKEKDASGNVVVKKPYSKWSSFYLNPLPENTVEYRATSGIR
ncbi:MAG: hypothetical protein H6601_11135 [Flavobacteriales bacterium]|nr:hypothetical protein [Flavobacteriales bacterium]MCB9203871.1 hypothetical protein [Flavobacteriales bacterium]